MSTLVSSEDPRHQYNTRSTTRSEVIPGPAVPSPRHKMLRISQTQFEEARSLFLQDPSRGPVCLARGISLQGYYKYCTNHPRLPLRICLRNWNVEAYELPDRPHDIIAGTFNTLVNEWDPTRQLYCGSDRDIQVGQTDMISPDCNVEPIHLPPPLPGQGSGPNNDPYPTVIVEVATSQGLPSVHAKVRLWFSPQTQIQLCLVIKIWGRRLNNTIAMVALLYQRANPNPLTPTNAIP